MRESKIDRHPFLAMAALLFLVLVGCTTAPMPSAYASPRLQASPTPTATPAPTPVVKDLSARPQIWFSPLDPSPPDASRPFNGGPDFMALFEEDAPWEHAADAIHVFKLYGGWVAGAATDDELRRVVGDLNRRGVAIGFEASPLRYGSDCAAWLDEGRRITRRLQEAGAVVRFVAFDHPYDTGVLAPAPDGCGLSAEQAAQGVAEYAAAIRERFPDVVVGSIETAANEVAEVERWVDAYRSAAGEDFDFFHLDLNFARPDWPEATLEIETFLRGRGIEIGMIYFGNWEDRSDAVWLGRVEDRFTRYELLGGRPEHAIFQSWHPYPQRILPETAADTFTAIIHRYLRPRPQLTLDLDAAGSLATGRLTGGDGAPMPGREVALSVVPTDGPGLWHEYTVSGTAPAGAAFADVGYRVNTECACRGQSQFTLASVRYAEGWVQDAQEPYEVSIPSADLASGAADWAVWGTAPNWVDADGLHVAAEPGQDAAANSPRFAVTGGATYTATFVARVAPESLGSGYFSIIFNDGQAELTRQLIPLAAVVPLGTTTTDGDGRYELIIDPVAVSRGALRAEFAGSDAAWPARVEMPISR